MEMARGRGGGWSGDAVFGWLQPTALSTGRLGNVFADDGPAYGGRSPRQRDAAVWHVAEWDFTAEGPVDIAGPIWDIAGARFWNAAKARAWCRRFRDDAAGSIRDDAWPALVGNRQVLANLQLWPTVSIAPIHFNQRQVTLAIRRPSDQRSWCFVSA